MDSPAVSLGAQKSRRVRPPEHRAIACAVASLLAFPRGASADPPSWVSAGVNLGAASHAETSGFLIGGEASFAYASQTANRDWVVWWRGAYADAVYDTSTKRVRLSLGPEFGYLGLGFDFGPVLELGGTAPHVGFAIRPHLAFVYVIPYARLECCLDDGRASAEFGALLKYPLYKDRRIVR